MKAKVFFSGARAWKLSTVIALSALGLLACQHPARVGSRAEGEQLHSIHKSALQLNDGKKWLVDEGMMVPLREMEKAVRAFEVSPKGDHHALAVTIQENLGQLVTSCTMTGRAHDELHKWLMPLLGASAEYVKATEPNVQEEKYRQIREAMTVFNEYFEARS